MPTARYAAYLCAALLYACVFAACGESAAPAIPAPPTPAPATAVHMASAAPADTLRWSVEGATGPRSIDPAKPGDTQGVTIGSLIFAGLVRLGETLDVQPDGASDWRVSDAGRTYTFTIRDGLTFANGRAVTAEDFVYSITRALAPETAAYGAPAQLSHIQGAADVVSGKARAVSGLKALDARTLQITLDEPVAYFLAQLTYPYTFAVPRELVERGADWTDAAYGTGPYRIKEWKRGEYMLLAASEHYWGGKPGVPFVRFVFNPDSDAAFQQYQRGDLDIMGSGQNPVPAARIPEVQNLPDFRSAPASLQTRYVGFNNRKAPFDNEDVRRAFALAVDKRTLANETLAGQALPADRILPTGLLGTQQPIRPLLFDPGAAKAALAQAGYPDGQGLPPITLTYGQEGDNETVVKALQRDWKNYLGVQVALQPMPLDAFSSSLDQTYRTPEAGLQMYYSIWTADYPDPQNFLSQQLHTGVPNNNGHWSDAAFDRLVDEADKLSDRTQVDRRIKLYNQAEQIGIDKVGWLPLIYPRTNMLVRPRVQGIVLTPNGLLIPDYTKLRLV